MTQLPPQEKIRFTSPLIDEIREKGYLPVDMHVHTHRSDAAIRIPSLVKRAGELGIGVAVTDHNEIQGAIEAATLSPDLPIIPGIELNSLEGPHILLYFYTMADLAEFFSAHVRGDLKKSQYMGLQVPVAEILEAAEGYRCVKVAAHPFGYFGINRGVLKCIENETLPPGILGHLDGIEVICGAMSQDINERAAIYAGEHSLPVTGGSDAHVLPAVGGVVTCAKAEGVEGFLDGILSKKSIVIGRTAHPLHKGMAAGVIAWNYIPSAVATLQVHYEENMPRLMQYLRDLVK